MEKTHIDRKKLQRLHIMPPHIQKKAVNFLEISYKMMYNGIKTGMKGVYCMKNDIIRNETIDAIINRRTTREYKDSQITGKELDTLLTAALWAPSGRNSQPCHVRALQDRDALKEINVDFKNLVGWQTPAYSRWETNPVYQNAPTLIFIFAQDNSAMAAGLMAQNITIAAESIGLGSCIIGSIGALMDNKAGEKWKEKLNISNDWKFLIAIAVGYKDEEAEVKPRDESHFQTIVKLEV